MIARSWSAAIGVNCLIWSARHRRGMHDHGLQAGGEFFDLRRPVAQQRRRRHQQARSGAARLAPPAAATGPGWSCPAPCRRPGRRRGRDWTAGASTACRCAGRAATCPSAPGPGSATVAVRRTQRLQGLLQPWAGGDARPVGVGRGRVVAGDGRHRPASASPRRNSGRSGRRVLRPRGSVPWCFRSGRDRLRPIGRAAARGLRCRPAGWRPRPR